MSWEQFHKQEEKKDYFKELIRFVNHEYTDETIQFFTKIFPPQTFIYRAFDLCPLEKTRIIIIGQDPYHQPGQANGLAFAVNEDETPPPSLQNIMKESGTTDRTLISWADQGILLLNTCLTVRESKPLSHAGKGWETYTSNAIEYLLQYACQNNQQLIFCLWGRHAQKILPIITRYNTDKRFYVICTSHPSPLAFDKTDKPFAGSRQFEMINEIIKEPIKW